MAAGSSRVEPPICNRSDQAGSQVKPGLFAAQPAQSRDQPCRFVSCRGHVTALQKLSLIDRQLVVEAVYQLP